MLVCTITDPSWTPLFLGAAAVVCDTGALQSHAAIVSRELGIPAVLSVPGITAVADGTMLHVDGDDGHRPRRVADREPDGGHAGRARVWVRIAPWVRDASISDGIGTQARIRTQRRAPAVARASGGGDDEQPYSGRISGVPPIFWQNPASTGRATPVTYRASSEASRPTGRQHDVQTVGVATLARMANEAMRDSWATGAQGWVRNERIFDAVFTPFTAAILGAAELGSARRVLDVGCGTGTLLDAAVAAGADAVGVDISPAMVEAARRRVPAATVVTADAQTADLLAAAPGEPFDRVVSRFGVMFFVEPEAAFANIRSATVPGARLTFACWREDEAEMFSLGLRALMARQAVPPAPPMPGTPGPMGLANADRLREVLGGAGWSGVSIEPADGLCDYAIDGSDGVEERLAVALSGMVGQAAQAELEPRLGPDGWYAVLEEARAELRAHVVDGALRFVGHTWLVTATNER